MINNIKDFCNRIERLKHLENAYYVFEEDCTDELRDQIYNLVDDSSVEPFRDAMHYLGFVDY